MTPSWNYGTSGGFDATNGADTGLNGRREARPSVIDRVLDSWTARSIWIVVPASPAGDRSDGELREELPNLVGEWQATITELVMEHVPTGRGTQALLGEIGRGQ